MITFTSIDRLRRVLLAVVLGSAMLASAPAGAVLPDCETAASAPACDGACPDSPSGSPQFCFTVGSSCFCTGMPCGDVFGACLGECPPGEACIDTGSSCQCQTAAQTCGPSLTSPECDGDCGVGFQCIDSGSGCTCAVATFVCGDGTFPAPQCNGQCPSGTTCFDFGGTCTCAAGATSTTSTTTTTSTMPPTTTTLPVTPIVSPLGGALLAGLVGLTLGRRRRRLGTSIPRAS